MSKPVGHLTAAATQHPGCSSDMYAMFDAVNKPLLRLPSYNQQSEKANTLQYAFSFLSLFIQNHKKVTIIVATDHGLDKTSLTRLLTGISLQKLILIYFSFGEIFSK